MSQACGVVSPFGPPAVVIGLDSATGLQVARILAAAGVRVVGLATRADHWACRTRVVDRVIEVEDTAEALLSALCDPLLVEPGSVLFPCSDQSVLAIAHAADRLRPIHRFSDPPLPAVESLLDKQQFASIALDAGVRTPRTVVVTGSTDIAEMITDLRPPLVLKPPVKQARWLAEAPEKAIKLDESADVSATIRRALAWADPLLVQEWIDGPDSALVTCNCYIDLAGNVESAVVSAKLRQWPPRTGTASAAITIDDPEVAATAARLLTSTGFFGLGYVEFKRFDGELVAIEANVGRPTGRSAMAEAAGVEMHMALYRDLAGIPRGRLGAPAAGVVWVHLRRDLQAALWNWRRHDLTPVSWARSLGGQRVEAVGSWRDPMPFVADLWYALTKRIGFLRSDASDGDDQH